MDRDKIMAGCDVRRCGAYRSYYHFKESKVAICKMIKGREASHPSSEIAHREARILGKRSLACLNQKITRINKGDDMRCCQIAVGRGAH